MVFPGAIATNIAHNPGVGDSMKHMNIEQSPIKMLLPKKAAKIILDGIEKDRYQILVGQDANFMDFVCRISPERAARFIYSQMKSLLPA